MTRREAAVLTLYTGVVVGDFADAIKLAEEFFPGITTIGMMASCHRLKELVTPEFLALKIE